MGLNQCQLQGTRPRIAPHLRACAA